ncbi:MAG: type II toxin-antitoxin system Phd/YefM family antitoxin [Thermomicrobiales bacterium]
MPAFPIPIEKHMSLSDVKQQFSRVVNEVARGESTVIVEKHRRPTVAMVSYSDYQNFLRREEVRNLRTNKRP